MMTRSLRGGIVLALGMSLSSLIACSGEQTQTNRPAVSDEDRATESAAAPADLSRAEFRVEGMTCGGCAIGTRAALKKLQGVEDAGASYEDSRAWALYHPAKITPEEMMAAIRELGYTPTLAGVQAQS